MLSTHIIYHNINALSCICINVGFRRTFKNDPLFVIEKQGTTLKFINVP